MTAVAQEPGFTGEEIQTSLKDALGESGPAPIAVLLNRVMRSVTVVGKHQEFKDERGGQRAEVKYNFRGIDAVINALGPALREHRVLTIPALVDLSARDIQSANNRRMSEVRVQVRYVFTGPLGDSIEAVVPGEAIDISDKATAKAMSVAWRTALIQVFALPTGDPDPDSQYFERGNGAPRSTADEATDREAMLLSREEKLFDLAALLKEVEETDGVYQAADRIAKYCATAHKVDIVTERGGEGQIEKYDLEKLNDNQLTVTLRKVRSQLALAKAAEAAM